jgi:hypothetical protein
VEININVLMFRHYTQYYVLSYCLGIDHGVQYTNVVILTSRAIVSALYLPFSFSFGNSLAAAFMSVITWNEWIPSIKTNPRTPPITNALQINDSYSILVRVIKYFNLPKSLQYQPKWCV